MGMNPSGGTSQWLRACFKTGVVVAWCPIALSRHLVPDDLREAITPLWPKEPPNPRRPTPLPGPRGGSLPATHWTILATRSKHSSTSEVVLSPKVRFLTPAAASDDVYTEYVIER